MHSNNHTNWSARLWATSGLYCALCFLVWYRRGGNMFALDSMLVVLFAYTLLHVAFHITLSVSSLNTPTLRENLATLVAYLERPLLDFILLHSPEPRCTVVIVLGTVCICFLMSTVRFHRFWLYIPLTLMNHTLFSRFVVSSFNETYSGYGELMFPFFSFPVMALYFVDKLNRDAFEVVDIANMQANNIADIDRVLVDLFLSFQCPTSTEALSMHMARAQAMVSKLSNSAAVLFNEDTRSISSIGSLTSMRAQHSKPRYTYPSTVIVAAQTSIADGEFAMARVDPEDLV
eukprot:PhM_4_TR14134/c1_g1_i4/m.39321